MTTLDEQETIIVASRTSETVDIYTSNTHDLAYYLTNPDYTLVREYRDGITGEVNAAEFTIPAERTNYRKIAKRQMSEKQRREASERLAKVRATRNTPSFPN